MRKYLSKPATETKTSLLSVHPFFSVVRHPNSEKTAFNSTTKNNSFDTTQDSLHYCSCLLLASSSNNFELCPASDGASECSRIKLAASDSFRIWIVHCHCWWKHQLLRLKHCILQFGNFTYQQVYWGFVHQHFDSFRPKCNFHPPSSLSFCLGNPTYFRVCSIFLSFFILPRYSSEIREILHHFGKSGFFHPKWFFCTQSRRHFGNPSTAQLS